MGFTIVQFHEEIRFFCFSLIGMGLVFLFRPTLSRLFDRIFSYFSGFSKTP